jgi:hypothetical protein
VFVCVCEWWECWRVFFKPLGQKKTARVSGDKLSLISIFRTIDTSVTDSKLDPRAMPHDSNESNIEINSQIVNKPSSKQSNKLWKKKWGRISGPYPSKIHRLIRPLKKKTRNARGQTGQVHLNLVPPRCRITLVQSPLTACSWTPLLRQTNITRSELRIKRKRWSHS